MRIKTHFYKAKKHKNIKNLIRVTVCIIVGLIVFFIILNEASVSIVEFYKSNVYSQRQSISAKDSVFNTEGRYNYYSIYDLDGIEHSKYIEIALSAEDDYKIEFLLDDVSGYIIIGTKNMEYDKYIYLIPEHIREKGFNKIRISALGGDGQYSMGNVVLHETMNVDDFQNCEIVDYEIKILDVDIEKEYMKKLGAHRSDALARLKILPEDTIYYPAKINFEGKTIDTEIRLKGGYIDHVVSSKWSFKFKLDKKCIWGMNKFAIHRPQSRNGITEYIMHDIYKNEGGLYQNYDFVQVVINGEYWGVYAYEQSVDKVVINNSDRPESVAVGFERRYANYRTVYDNRYKYSSDICTHLKVFKEQSALSEDVLYNYTQYAFEAYHIALNNEVDISTLIDFDKLASYIALCETFKGTHGYNIKNLLFYINSVTNKLEPISHDMLGMYSGHISSTYYRSNSLLRHVFDYPDFMEKYIDYLGKYANGYDDYIKENIEEIKKREYILTLDNCNDFDYINGYGEYHNFILDTLDSENSTFLVTQDESGRYYMDVDSGSVITVDVQRIIVDSKEMDIEFNGREKIIYLDSALMKNAISVIVEYIPIYAPNLEVIAKEAILQVGGD